MMGVQWKGAQYVAFDYPLQPCAALQGAGVSVLVAGPQIVPNP